MDNNKPRFSLILDEDFPLLQLLRSMFIGSGSSYSVDDLADELGISSHSLYKMFSAERPLRADVMLAAMIYANRKNRHDRRIADYVNNLLGLETRPRMNPRVQRFVKNMESQLLDLFSNIDTKES